MFYLNESCKLVLSEWLIQVFNSDPPLELLKLRSYSQDQNLVGVHEMIESLASSKITSLKTLDVSDNSAWSREPIISGLLMAIQFR